MILLLLILAQTSPHLPIEVPTLNNIVPYVVAGLMSGGSVIIWFILNKLWKQGDEVRAEMHRLNDNAYFSNRARLMGLARDAALHPELQKECVEIVREYDAKNPELAKHAATGI